MTTRLTAAGRFFSFDSCLDKVVYAVCVEAKDFFFSRLGDKGGNISARLKRRQWSAEGVTALAFARTAASAAAAAAAAAVVTDHPSPITADTDTLFML